MKKAAKVFALLGLGTLFIGIFICIAGFAMGGRFHSYDGFRGWMYDHYYYSDYNENRALTEIAIEDSAREYAYYDDDYYKELKGTFDTLDIDIGYGNCYIMSGGDQDITTISGMDIDESCLSAKITSGGVLEISYDQPGIHNNWGNYNDEAPELTITIPEKEYKKLIVNMEAGEMTAENLRAEKAEIEVGAGQLYLNYLDVAETCTMKVEAGHIQVESLHAKKLEVQCEVGSIESYETNITNGNLTCEMGSISMYMKDSESHYNYTIKSEMGSVTVGGDSYTGLEKKRSVDNGADRNLDLNCEMGSIELYFN